MQLKTDPPQPPPPQAAKPDALVHGLRIASACSASTGRSKVDTSQQAGDCLKLIADWYPEHLRTTREYGLYLSLVSPCLLPPIERLHPPMLGAGERRESVRGGGEGGRVVMDWQETVQRHVRRCAAVALLVSEFESLNRQQGLSPVSHGGIFQQLEPLVCLYEERVKEIADVRDAEVERILRASCGFPAHGGSEGDATGIRLGLLDLHTV